MKQYLLPSDAEYKLRRAVLLAAGVLVLAAIINLLLTINRTDANHSACLVGNILMDIGALWFAQSYWQLKISPQRQMLRLIRQAETIGTELYGSVLSLSEESRRIQSLDCLIAQIKTNNGERTVFVPTEGALRLIPGKSVKLSVCNNIVVSMENVP